MATPRREQKKSRERQVRAARAAARKRQRAVKVFAVVGVFALIAALIVGVAGGFGGSSTSTATTTTTSTSTPASSTTVEPGAVITSDTPCPKEDGSSAHTTKFAKVPPTCIDPSKKYTATFDTTEGKVVVPLDTAKTPNTANNFIVLARYHYYDKTNVFRIATSIDIIQGGSPHSQDNGDAGPGYTINDEGTSFNYTAGDLVMARTQQPNSASAQYFFGAGPNVAGLNGQGPYVTFGHATEGLDVLKKIEALNSGDDGPPTKTVTVNSVTISQS